MKKIIYVTGDATLPVGEGPKLLVSLSNDKGGWGAGFVLAISRRWKEPERMYRTWAHQGEFDGVPFALGQIQLVQVADNLTVVNLIGQQGYWRRGSPPPVRYDAIRYGLARVRERALELGASVHMPRIGCGLAGGSWTNVEPIIEEELCAHDISVTVYDLTR